MNDRLKEKLSRIEPYVPGEQPKGANIIKLNTNENPYPPSQRVLNALKEIDGKSLNLYPDFVCSELKQELGKLSGTNEDEIFLSNGSDEVLALCFKAFFNSETPVLFPEISYSFYSVWTEFFNIPHKCVPLKEDFHIDIDGFICENGGIVIPNPNAPTAIAEGKDSLIKIIENNPDSVVIIDEAYVDFSDKGSVADLIHKYDNLVVAQTYSKSRALAGIRFGFAYANSELINVLEGVKNSFNSYTVNTVTKVLAYECLKDRDYFNETVEKIKKTRAELIKGLDKLGFETLDSSANFVFTTKKDADCEALFEYLKANNIYVRHFNNPKIKNYLRITVGTDEAAEALLKKISEYFEKKA